MAFSEPEKTDIRRFCGYPAFGSTATGFANWRFSQASGLLEFRMNNLSSAEEAVVRRHLGTLLVLEHAVPRSAENLDTDQASVWTRNRDELRDRTKLLEDWRHRLCGFFGIPPGPAMRDSSKTFIV
jgi:hypothetical protein